MLKNVLYFVLIVLVVIALALMVWSNSYADMLFDDFAKWERVKTVYVNETRQSPSKIIFILKNPVPSETIYAIIEINDYCIPYYILVGKDVRKFFINKPNYKEVKISKEDKEKIWTFLRMKCGIQLI